MTRQLGAEELALWRKVVASVRPLHRAVPPEPVAAPPVAAPAPPSAAVVSVSPPKPTKPGTTLDAGWDRRLSRGLVQPDRIVDLHGHNLATAYDLIDRRLDQAIATGGRLLLLITGTPTGTVPAAGARSGRRWTTGLPPRATPATSPRSAAPIPATAAPARSTSCCAGSGASVAIRKFD